MPPESARKLTVAVTGATGDVGTPLVRALARCPEIGAIRAMSRRVPDELRRKHPRIDYRAGDVCDRNAMRSLVDGVDVLVHLAFSMFGTRAEMGRTNIDGTTSVCTAACEASVGKLIYASSSAAYGFSRDRPLPISERETTEVSPGDLYASHKTLAERLVAITTADSGLACYVLRPSIVAGRSSLGLIRTNPLVAFSKKLPPSLRRRYLDGRFGPLLMPDTGVRWQLVHGDDLALAVVGVATGSPPPGAYNLAAPGDIGQADLARELGWRAVSVPRSVARRAARMVHWFPPASPRSRFLANMSHRSVTVDCSKAHEQLGWRPVNDAVTTLRETVAAARAIGIA